VKILAGYVFFSVCRSFWPSSSSSCRSFAFRWPSSEILEGQERYLPGIHIPYPPYTLFNRVSTIENSFLFLRDFFFPMGFFLWPGRMDVWTIVFSLFPLPFLLLFYSMGKGGKWVFNRPKVHNRPRCTKMPCGRGRESGHDLKRFG
jgi:hypothetical protein